MNIKNLLQFSLYCICGGIGVTTDFSIYYASVSLGIWYQAANVIGYSSGTLVSFFLNRNITFKVHDKLTQRMALFCGVAAIGFVASAILLWLMVDIIVIDPTMAKLFTLPVVVIFQFSMNRWITFKESGHQQA